jgi:hyaluronan synthase
MTQFKYPTVSKSKKEAATTIDGCKMPTSKKGWIIRISALIFLISLIVIYIFYLGMVNITEQPIYVYSACIISLSLLIYTIAWIFYNSPVDHDTIDILDSINKVKKTKLNGKKKQMLQQHYNLDLVSVIIPVYNQEDMIETVIDSISKSTYRNIEIIVVNDGSTDSSGKILDGKLMHNYTNLKVIHKNNEGKRKAVATGFFKSKGKYIVLIDSDSVVDNHAIEEFVRAFNSDLELGAVTGHTKLWNSDKNFITKCQDAWYDYEFNISKACESYFRTVTCCCGCLSAYRRNAIEDFILLWMKNSNDCNISRIDYITKEDFANREIENIERRNKLVFSRLSSLKLKLKSSSSYVSSNLLRSLASYDDSEDRALTTFCLMKWKTAYVYSAICYTDVPEKLSTFIKQQKRWKKGHLRANLFATTFFWSKKNPIMSLIFYAAFAISFISPIITIAALSYGVLVLHHIWSSPLFLVGGFLAIGFFEGLDYKMRDPNAKYWKYKPIMNIILSFMISWLIFYAILKYKKDVWLTR